MTMAGKSPLAKNSIPMTVFPEENPLVSIIVRSVARPELAVALESVADQNYTNIEVILVDALGSAHPELESRCGAFPLRRCSTGTPLRRSAAANLGLDNAAGKFIIFLDDDDYFSPSHIAMLVQALTRQAGARAAYSGVEVVDAAGSRVTGVINEPFHRLLLLQKNYLAIHSVLFERSLLDDGCRFDLEMDVYEDWDFWIQVSMHTRFIHLDTISAYYRSSQSSSGAGAGINTDEELKAAGSRKIFEKWKQVQMKLAESIQSLQRQGLQLQRDKRLDEAKHRYETILSIQPDNVNALNLLGMIAYEYRQHERALQLIGQALNLNDRVAGLHLNYGLVLQAQGRKQDAANSYRRGLMLDPANAAIKAKLATVNRA